MVRDRLTWLLYLQNGLYGWFLYAVAPALALLREDQGVSRAVSSLHGTVFAAGAITAGLLQARVIGRLGRGRALWAAVGGAAVGAVLICVSTALPVTLLGALVAGLSGSTLLNGINAALVEHHGAAAPAALTETNAVAAGVGVLAPLSLGAGIALGVGWRAGLLAFVPLAALLWLVLGRVPVPAARPLPAPAGGRRARLPRRFWIAWAALVCITGVEFCMTIWSADLVRSRTGVAADAAASAVSAFLGGVLLGRIVGARLAARRDPSRLLLGAFALCGAGFVVLWRAPAYPVAVLGLFVVGLGASVQFPLGAARALGLSGGLTDRASGLSAVAVGSAVATFPFVLGALADRLGVPGAFLVVPVLLAAGAGCVLATRRGAAPRT